jgi:hypothetical protein
VGHEVGVDWILYSQDGVFVAPKGRVEVTNGLPVKVHFCVDFAAAFEQLAVIRHKPHRLFVILNG